MSLTVNAINAQPIKAWCVSLQTAADAVEGLNVVKALGWTGPVDTTNWSVVLRKAGKQDALTGSNGCWIVTDGTHVDLISNTDFIALYTANVPLVWAATTAAPDAAPQSGLSVHIFCPAPTSANGPWTYSIRLVDANGNATEITDQPTLTNGQLSWTVSGLTASEYTGTITVATHYSGVEASSLPFTFTAAP